LRALAQIGHRASAKYGQDREPRDDLSQSWPSMIPSGIMCD